MITLNGTIQRKFFFPADPLTTLIYFSELSRVAHFLPYITVIETYSADKVRIRYQTVELGAYTINIFCDLDSVVDIEKQEIAIMPLGGRDGVVRGDVARDDVARDDVAREATLNATTGYGYYSSAAKLYAEEDGTSIDYRLQFKSELLRPRGLRMMPKRVVDRIAQSISFSRVEEIAEGFMENALEAFDDWLAEQPNDLARQWLTARESEPAGLSSAPKGE